MNNTPEDTQSTEKQAQRAEQDSSSEAMHAPAPDQSADENAPHKVVLPEGEYAKYLAELAARIVDERTRAREARWRTAVGGVLTVLAVLGFSNISSIRSDLEASGKVRVDQAVPVAVQSYFRNHRGELVGESLQEIQQEVDSKVAFIQLVALSSELASDGRKSFSNSERDTALALLKEAVQSEKIGTSPQFALPLERVVDTFMGADLEPMVDELDDSFRAQAIRHSGIAASMLQHYGLRTCGAIELVDTDLSRFRVYADAMSKSHRAPELSAPFELCVEYRKSGGQRTETSDGILQDIRHLERSEKLAFLEVMDVLASGRFASKKTGKVERVEALMTRVSSLFEADLESIRQGAASADAGDGIDLETFLGQIEALGESAEPNG